MLEKQICGKWQKNYFTNIEKKRQSATQACNQKLSTGRLNFSFCLLPKIPTFAFDAIHDFLTFFLSTTDQLGLSATLIYLEKKKTVFWL